MDYKKTNAPLNTVTRDMIELSEDTGNVYETVCIIAKRAIQANLRKSPKTASRSKFHATTRNSPNPPLSPPRST